MPATILVVDDESEIDTLIEKRFRKQIRDDRFRFLFARNGREALEILRTQPQIDSVITDLNMPEMDGLALLDRLPDIDRHLKAIVVSAYGDLDSIRAAMNRGAFDFLVKPIDFRDLEITLNKTLDFVRHQRQQQRQLQIALDELHAIAYTDRLTGLANRSYLTEAIATHIDRGHCFSVLLLNIDRYDIVKYGFGHDTSDRLLVEIARRLRECVAPSDVIARTGNHEFAIFPIDPTESQPAELARRLHQALEFPFKLGDFVVSTRVHIGIAPSSIGYRRPEDFLRAADTAMHCAQMRGGDRTVVFETAMQERAAQRLQLEADLYRAVTFNQLHLNYQPLVALETLRPVGFEALVRWQHPRRGPISPVEFVPLAEETELIVPLGSWVLGEACRQMGEWRSRFGEGWPACTSINLSGIELGRPDLLSRLDRVLERTGIDGSHLELEITESVFVDNDRAIVEVLNQLRSRQIRACIDDFGTGYSSLSYLQTLPVDTLKIDRAFVSDIERSRKNFDIVKTIVTLARSLGLETIAEGIETRQQLDILRDLGCEYGQGYYFSRPLDRAACEVWMGATKSDSS